MIKRYVPIAECRTGDIVAEDLYGKDKLSIINENTVINDYIKKRLQMYGVQKLYVFRPLTPHEKSIAENMERIGKEYDANLITTKQLINELSMGDTLKPEKINNVVNSLMSDFAGDYHLLISCITKIKAIDDYTYTHSVNVAMYAMLLAKWLKMEETQVRSIVKAGLLHDIGKSRISPDIINKRGPLSPDEFDEIKKHPVIGYNIAKTMLWLNENTKRAILMHHEREDSTGYPLGISGSHKNIYAKIISIVDAYDALTSERAYKSRVTPFDTFKEFERIGIGTFDLTIMFTFLSNISQYYIGAKVRLNTGQTGEVVFISPHNIANPVIRIGDEYLDLSRTKEFRISEMI